MRSSRLHIVAVITLGGTLGYLTAAAGPENVISASLVPKLAFGNLASQSVYPDKAQRASQARCCCSEVAHKEELLVLAGDNAAAAVVQEPDKKPNILVIWGDDIGQSNISAYTMGLVGYRTPNIDRIAREGMIFTDCYGEQSCTAGRSAFITGQSVFRTGLSKVGIPAAAVGLRAEDPTIAELLKPLGYATGQFGKNHLGDRNEFLPTLHGFDEFFGNLYHLNAEEEPEHEDYPKNPEFRRRFGPRGVLKCKATDKDDPTVDARFGKIGKQSIEDTGALTRKRMETIDDETTAAACDFMKRHHQAGKSFFCWWNGTRMHFRTHVRKENRGKSGQDEYADGMVEHDGHVGQLLQTLDDLGIGDHTIVFYSTDNGPHYNTWPDAAATPFRSEKNTNWEGGWRVPGMVRWPGKIKPGSVSNEIIHHMDWMSSLLAAAGEPDIKQKLLAGHQAGGKTYRVHLDGYNFLPYLTGQSKTGPRREVFYFSDDGDLTALRYGDWKIIFMEQRAEGTFKVWANPFTPLRVPLLFNLRRDPYERAQLTSNTYYDWTLNRTYLFYGATALVNQFLSTFKEYPPRQRPPSFSINQALERLQQRDGR
jgi:arylsulfatase